jgi:hypothetical protein
MKHFIKASLLLSVCLTVILLCTSFSTAKPHLIVGLWSSTNEAIITSPAGEALQINQWYFSSDAIISAWYFKSTVDTAEDDKNFRMAYRMMNAKDAAEIYDDLKPFAQSNQELIMLKSTCHEDFNVIFTVHELTKNTLKVRFEPTASSPQVKGSSAIMTFERIAGPPENMD